MEGQGWFLGIHVFTKYVKLAFFSGAALRPLPPGTSKQKDVRYLDLFRGELMLDFGVFGIPAYFGLMRLDRTWRTWTLAMTGIGLAAITVLPIIGRAIGGPVTVQMFGVQLGTLSHDWVWIMMVPLFVLYLWQLRVLLRPDVRAIFATASPS